MASRNCLRGGPATFLYLLLGAMSFSTGCASLERVHPEPFTPAFKGAELSDQAGQKRNASVAAIAPGGEIKSSAPVNPNPIAQWAALAGSIQSIQFPQYDQLINQFRRSLLSDTERILKAKGYAVKVAYDSLESLTFSDKKSLDFVILPEININLAQNAIGDPRGGCSHSTPFLVLIAGSFSCHVQVATNGTFSFSLIEPMSREKLMMKTYQVKPGGMADCEASAKYYAANDFLVAHRLATQALANACNAAVARQLESLFQEISSTLVKFLPGPEEAQELAKQAQELKSRKVF